ncbi:hypothetical protein [Pseudochryseolinea flava]|uniref:Lipoprotein n=1 Tax=Pseudochryseolinea flava TaxID=2059302 RepID=A0A364XY11_9BACT|nr:hypothetical protein [Pseudochryseolinea flava]RAV99191.1 hypothetical protein DQQ10_20030 [Pseudochryseolinea flava]
MILKAVIIKTREISRCVLVTIVITGCQSESKWLAVESELRYGNEEMADEMALTLQRLRSYAECSDDHFLRDFYERNLKLDSAKKYLLSCIDKERTDDELRTVLRVFKVKAFAALSPYTSIDEAARYISAELIFLNEHGRDLPPGLREEFYKHVIERFHKMTYACYFRQMGIDSPC